jgi:glutathione peroxidase
MPTPLQSIPLETIRHQPATLGDYQGQVVLVVNVASQCGLTPQYAGLERLHETYAARGLVVAGFPANDFGAQEPGTDAEIEQFCTTKFNVAFPMFAKIAVTGATKHPLYGALTAAMPQKTGDAAGFRARLKEYGMTPTEDPEVLWNFEKFLIGRDGNVIGRFAPTVAPDDPALIAAIEAALGAA